MLPGGSTLSNSWQKLQQTRPATHLIKAKVIEPRGARHGHPENTASIHGIEAWLDAGR
jgi:hypothetical protein